MPLPSPGPNGPLDPPTLALLRDTSLHAAERDAKLLPLVYEELRQLAQQVMRGERRDHTLQATALVHEAFLRLVGPNQLPWQNRAHFFGAAAAAMRRILVDHARARSAKKRGGKAVRDAALALDGLPDPESEQQAAGFLLLDDAIERLARAHPDAAEVVRLRYFAGLDVDTTAAMLGVSAPTVKRTWAFARGWLRATIDSEQD
ncbi:MAG: ECF-type sigma factor [Planctomycetes bacterium]|jgi:RNA polymerase sigma factor (TIGR02999 family)|nr:ECF-type sigma factor [Planctomycetota bacterium]